MRAERPAATGRASMLTAAALLLLMALLPWAGGVTVVTAATAAEAPPVDVLAAAMSPSRSVNLDTGVASVTTGRTGAAFDWGQNGGALLLTTWGLRDAVLVEHPAIEGTAQWSSLPVRHTTVVEVVGAVAWRDADGDDRLSTSGVTELPDAAALADHTTDEVVGLVEFAGAAWETGFHPANDTDAARWVIGLDDVELVDTSGQPTGLVVDLNVALSAAAGLQDSPVTSLVTAPLDGARSSVAEAPTGAWAEATIALDQPPTVGDDASVIWQLVVRQAQVTEVAGEAAWMDAWSAWPTVVPAARDAGDLWEDITRAAVPAVASTFEIGDRACAMEATSCTNTTWVDATLLGRRPLRFGEALAPTGATGVVLLGATSNQVMARATAEVHSAEALAAALQPASETGSDPDGSPWATVVLVTASLGALAALAAVSTTIVQESRRREAAVPDRAAHPPTAASPAADWDRYRP